MAQDTGQQPIQTMKIQKPFRETNMGGFDRTWIFSADGLPIKPLSIRSRSGNHGWDTWELPTGRYAIVSITRPNLRNGAKPYSVVAQCIEVTTGASPVVKAEKKFVTMDWSLEDVRSWARSICP